MTAACAVACTRPASHSHVAYSHESTRGGQGRPHLSQRIAPCTRQVLRCIEEPKDAQALSSLTHLLFKHDWCYRPQEMTSAWYEVERGPKPRRGTEPWCSWGFAYPAVPGVCPASGGASEQK